jgi:hypothetical protein
VRSHEIKALAENWFKPRLEECREAFPRAVQAKLGELTKRGTATSPVAYAAVENLACQEVERCGQLFLTGYKEAFAAVSNLIRPAMLKQVKCDLDALLSCESARALKTIQYVRDVCKPEKTRDAVELRDRTQQKLVAELDLFVTKLNTDRGIRKNLLTVLLALLSFTFSYLPQWGASVWSLFSSRPLVPYLVEKMPAFGGILSAFNWNNVAIAMRLVGVILLLWLLIRLLRAVGHRRDNSGQ